jgi:hypothetical protein
MAPRFDPESLKLDLSVANLLESPFLRSLGFSSRGGYERLWLGQAIHGRYQEQKLEEDPSYRREVVISHVFEHRGWTVTPPRGARTACAVSPRKRGASRFVGDETAGISLEFRIFYNATPGGGPHHY